MWELFVRIGPPAGATCPFGSFLLAHEFPYLITLSTMNFEDVEERDGAVLAIL